MSPAQSNLPSQSSQDLLHSWAVDPPISLIIGDGPYAWALCLLLGGSQLGPQALLAGPTPNEFGGYPRVLGELERVFVVCDADTGAGDLLRLHNAVWRWVSKLSPDGDHHELTILFVLRPDDAKSVAKQLSIGLGLPETGWADLGHGFLRMGNSLEEILNATTAVKPQDLPPLRARQTADARHAALRNLRTSETSEELENAAHAVNEAFRDEEYLLDIFCRPPSHRNGNNLRSWLNSIVTGGVTPDGHTPEAEADQHPANWLADALSSSNRSESS